MSQVTMSAAGSDVRHMSARFSSVCGGCGGRIAKGAPIRYVKGLAATHEACGDPLGNAPAMVRTARNGWARAGSWKAQYGRCEDAPCCGCCD
jgi:hypothetical protein